MLLSLPELWTLDKDPFSAVLDNPFDLCLPGSMDLEVILDVLLGTSGGTFLLLKLLRVRI